MYIDKDKIKKFIIPFTVSMFTCLLILYILPQNMFHNIFHSKPDRTIASVTLTGTSYYLKIWGIFFISIVTVYISIYRKGFLNIFFYSWVYALICFMFLGSVIYYEISNGMEPNILTSVIATIILMGYYILFELFHRKRLRNIANGCLRGKRLSEYTKRPWIFQNTLKRDKLCILYFDIPDLAKFVNRLDCTTLKNIIDYIYSKSSKILSRHNGILVKRTDDSMIVAFEPGKHYKEVKNPEADCAYHTISCGIELNRMIEDIKEYLGNLSIPTLKGRAIVSTNNGLLMKHIRKGRMELSLFSDALYTIEDLTMYSKAGEFLTDGETFSLCSEYFVGKEITPNAYSIIGFSGY